MNEKNQLGDIKEWPVDNSLEYCKVKMKKGGQKTELEARAASDKTYQ